MLLSFNMPKRHDIYTKQDIDSLLKELEQFRKSSNLSQTALALRLGLRSYQTLFYWYKGKSKPYPRYLYRILQILGKRMTLEDFQAWQKERIR